MTSAMIDGLDVFWRQRALLDLDALSPDKRERVLPYIRDWAEGARGLSGERVFSGLSQMNEMRFAALNACRGFDFVLMPVAPTVAFAAELPSPLNDPARPFEHIAFTVPFNFSEQPAASINAGFSQAGLPIALQIVGRRFDDLGVLRLAAAFEGLRGPQRPWPLP
jgi:Asp-tRNA(Asn)/Glu-tRNA(Gln) amidotransferase A subunit family amidase